MVIRLSRWTWLKIIIEGADGSGKSTYARNLAQKHNLSYVDMRGKDPMTFEFCFNTLDKTNVVWDRHFLSERIYSKFYGLPCRLTKGQERTLVQKCKDNGIDIIIMIPKEHLLLDSEDEDSKERHHELVQAYKDIATEYNLEIRGW